MTKKPLFKNFAEFWHYTKRLSYKQRDLLLSAMPSSQRHKLKQSYEKDGWEDLFMRNILDERLDYFKKTRNLDLLAIRARVLDGETFYISSRIWEELYEEFSSYGCHSAYILSGIDVKKASKNTLALVSK